MSGTSEIMVVDSKQVGAMPSPEIANGNANGSAEAGRKNGSIRQSGSAFQTSAIA